MTQRILLALAATVVCAGCAHHRPLELAAMDRFNIDRYVMGCWAWPDGSSEPGTEENETYWRTLADHGFTAFTSGNSRAGMMRHIKGPVLDRLSFDPDLIGKLGLKALLDADHWAVWHLKALHEKYGVHPAVLGYWMSDDNADLYQHNIDVAWWLSTYAPDRVPWMTANPSPIPQSRCDMPVISTQNYPWMYRWQQPEEELRREFCESCEADRLLANRYDMASWMIIAANASPSQYRFQVNAPAAHGAQGVWLFVYNHYVRYALKDVMRPTHDYLVNTAGPWLLGRRCLEVLQTGGGAAAGQRGPYPGGLVEAMDNDLMAGLLVPDAQYQAGIFEADCIYVVDKRTHKFEDRVELEKLCNAQRQAPGPLPARAGELIDRMLSLDPAPRRSRMAFGPKVRAVSARLPDGRVREYDLATTREIELPPLRGGEAVLLCVDADPVKVVRVPASAAIRVAPQTWKFRPDTENQAERQQWSAPAFDDSEWKDIRVPFYLGWKYQPVNPAGGSMGNLHGNGWYRLKYALQADMLKKHIYIHFGAADEEAWVYVDGKLVVANSCESLVASLARVWHIPFSAEVTNLYKDGKEHTLAVRVHNSAGAGGLYEPVYIMAADEPLDDDQLWRMAKQKTREWTWLWE